MNPGNERFKKPTMCPRRITNITNTKGKFNSHCCENIAEMNELALFRMCFPEQFVIDVIIPETNKHLGTAMTLQEFYVWLGCIFYLACFQGISNRNKWWSSALINQFKGAPFVWLKAYISKTRFLDIIGIGAIRYTDQAQPLLFKDRFHKVRAMISAFNKHYEREYSPAWLSCLNESMNSWLNKFSPGLMVCPQNPWPFENEYHSIADSD
jgi:hypothetical protein